MKKVITGALTWLTALAILAAPAGAIFPMATAIDETKISVHNFNMGFVVNDIFARANSGWNFTLGPGADVGTGNASVAATVGTTMNTNLTGIAVSDHEWGPFAVNIGPGGLAIAWDKTSIRVCNVNFGLVFNDLDLLANTGHNFTWGSSVATGNASVRATVETTMNTNTTGISMAESGVGPVAANLGPGFAVAVEEDRISVHNFNMGFVVNDIFARANSGWNFTIGSGADVGTGNASVSTTVANTVNTNTTSVVKTDAGIGPVAANVSLGCIGEAAAASCGGAGVGPVAVNIGAPGIVMAVEKDSVEVGNVNNAVIINNETLLANTGNNVTNGCAGDPCQTPCAGTENNCPGPSPTPAPTTVDTGNASVTTSVSNTVNTNTTTIVVSE